MLKKAVLFLRTLKTLSPTQTVGRVYGKLKLAVGYPWIIYIPSFDDWEGEGFKPKTTFLNHDSQNSATALLEGEFTFLNKKKNLGFPPQWANQSEALLWQWQLHYFNYLPQIPEPHRTDLCLDWISKHKKGVLPAWNIYSTCLRLWNWMKCECTHPEILRSMFVQLQHVYANTEFFHPGNHYLENARTLIMGGLFFKGKGNADRFLKRGLKIVCDELPKQVLYDGNYFELTPMYHSLMVEWILDIINVLPDESPELPMLRSYAISMLTAMGSWVHPDGEIPLFSDSALGAAPSFEQLQSYAERLGIQPKPKEQRFDQAGIYILRSSELFMPIDCGPLGPPRLLAHAHADILNFELSWKGQRIIVDTGVFDYAEGKRRSYCRGTAAHNTVTVDGKDQAEMWKSFRVARRYRPQLLEFEEGKALEGSYRGYAELIGDYINHFRKINYSEDQRKIDIEDRVEGRGNHVAVCRLHFHPDVEVKIVSDNQLELSWATGSAMLLSDSTFELKQGEYYPQFGITQPIVVLEFHKSGFLPHLLRYSMVFT